MKQINRDSLLLATSMWISLVINWTTIKGFFLSPSAGSGLSAFVFATGGFLLILSLNYLFLVLGSLVFRGKSIKWWCSIVLLTASAISYFTISFGTQFDKTMFISLLQTNPGEALDIVTLRMLGWVLLLATLPIVLIYKAKLAVNLTARGSFFRSTLITFSLLLLTAVVVYSMYPRYASATRNRDVTFHTIAPLNLIAGGLSYAYALRTSAVVRASIGNDAQQSYALAKPRLIVFVLGETARAKSHGLNGYERDTTPRMKAANGMYFADTESCGTATAISVPCIFSGLSTQEFTLQKGREIETLIDVLHHAGTRLIWRDNDSGCKGVCDKAEYEDFTSSTNTLWCTDIDNCFDEILLDGLEQKVRQTKKDTLVVLHVKGSHGPAYYKRYPKAFERFTPTCKTSDLAACSELEIRNAYDNTIVYTDHVIGESITLLNKLSDQFATALFYVSDHGESLGEKGLFLHGIPRAVAPNEQTQVPMYAWVSPQFSKLEKWNRDCMANQTKTKRSHDNVYSTIIGFLDVTTKQYNPDLDIFAGCH